MQLTLHFLAGKHALMSEYFDPLTVAERLLGGIEAVSRIAGRSEKVGYQWRHANGKRAPGDLPGPGVMRSLLAHATANGIPLKPEHLIWGAPAAEIEALLADMPQADPPLEAAE